MAAKKSKRVDAAKQRAGIPKGEKLFMIRKTYPGVTYGKVPMERGRLIRLMGFINDQVLLRQGQIEEIADPSVLDVSECGKCGAEFINMEYRDAHFKREHKDVIRQRERTVHELTERQREQLLKKTGTYGPDDVGFAPTSTPEEMEIEKTIQKEEEIAPLNWDKTKASRK